MPAEWTPGASANDQPARLCGSAGGDPWKATAGSCGASTRTGVAAVRAGSRCRLEGTLRFSLRPSHERSVWTSEGLTQAEHCLSVDFPERIGLLQNLWILSPVDPQYVDWPYPATARGEPGPTLGLHVPLWGWGPTLDRVRGAGARCLRGVALAAASSLPMISLLLGRSAPVGLTRHHLYRGGGNPPHSGNK